MEAAVAASSLIQLTPSFAWYFFIINASDSVPDYGGPCVKLIIKENQSID